MKQRQVILAGLIALGFSGCGPGLTRAGDPGHWAMTKYLVRVYRVPQAEAFKAAKEYVLANGYEIEKESQDVRDALIHGLKAPKTSLGKRQSIIIRTRHRGNETQVEMKVGPNYSELETRPMFDEYQKLLPASAQPK